MTDPTNPTPAASSDSTAVPVPPGDITYVRADGSRYKGLAPVPCERQAYLALDGDGLPFCLMIDEHVYAVRPAPRTKLRGDFKLICLGERVPPKL